MSKDEVRFRVDASQNAWLSSEAKKAGVPKSKILLQLIDAAMGDHAKVNGTSDRMVGTKAMIALLENTDKTKWLNEDKQVLWFDGAIWFVGKTANGCQVQLDRWLESPIQILQGIGDYRLTKAKDVKQALANWHELKALDGIELLGDSWFDDGIDFFNGSSSLGGYRALKSLTIQRIAELKAVIEPTIEEITIEATNAPLCPYIEPVVDDTHLSSVEFRDRFGLVDDGYYGQAVTAGRTDGFLAPDGTIWNVAGKKTKAIWSLQLVKQLELAIA